MFNETGFCSSTGIAHCSLMHRVQRISVKVAHHQAGPGFRARSLGQLPQAFVVQSKVGSGLVGRRNTVYQHIASTSRRISRSPMPLDRTVGALNAGISRAFRLLTPGHKPNQAKASQHQRKYATPTAMAWSCTAWPAFATATAPSTQSLVELLLKTEIR